MRIIPLPQDLTEGRSILQINSATISGGREILRQMLRDNCARHRVRIDLFETKGVTGALRVVAIDWSDRASSSRREAGAVLDAKDRELLEKPNATGQEY